MTESEVYLEEYNPSVFDGKIRKGYREPESAIMKVKIYNNQKMGLAKVQKGSQQIAILKYNNGLLNGLCIFFINSMTDEYVWYVNDVAEGWAIKKVNGEVNSLILYENGLLTRRIIKENTNSNMWKEIEESTGNVVKEIEVDNDIIKETINSILEYEGEFNNLFQNSKLPKKDFQHGLFKKGHGTSYRNGSKYYTGEWKMNMPHGTGKLFYPSGNIAFSGQWESGQFTKEDGSIFDYVKDHLPEEVTPPSPEPVIPEPITPDPHIIPTIVQPSPFLQPPPPVISDQQSTHSLDRDINPLMPVMPPNNWVNNPTMMTPPVLQPEPVRGGMIYVPPVESSPSEPVRGGMIYVPPVKPLEPSSPVGPVIQTMSPFIQPPPNMSLPIQPPPNMPIATNLPITNPNPQSGISFVDQKGNPINSPNPETLNPNNDPESIPNTTTRNPLDYIIVIIISLIALLLILLAICFCIWFTKGVDYTACTMDELESMSFRARSLTIPENCMNDVSDLYLHLSGYKRLTYITIENNAFKYGEEMRLIDLPALRGVTVGNLCFNTLTSWDTSELVWDRSRSVVIQNCPELVDLTIGKGSFVKYDTFDLSNLPKLSNLEVGTFGEDSSNFYFGSLVLRNLPSLTTVVVGGYSFADCKHKIIQDLPLLESIKLGKFSLVGLYEHPQLTMKDLPALKSIISLGYSFLFIETVTLEMIPNLTAVSLPQAFGSITEKTIENASLLEDLLK